MFRPWTPRHPAVFILSFTILIVALLSSSSFRGKVLPALHSQINNYLSFKNAQPIHTMTKAPVYFFSHGGVSKPSTCNITIHMKIPQTYSTFTVARRPVQQDTSGLFGPPIHRQRDHSEGQAQGGCRLLCPLAGRAQQDPSQQRRRHRADLRVSLCFSFYVSMPT